MGLRAVYANRAAASVVTSTGCLAPLEYDNELNNQLREQLVRLADGDFSAASPACLVVQSAGGPWFLQTLPCHIKTSDAAAVAHLPYNTDGDLACGCLGAHGHPSRTRDPNAATSVSAALLLKLLPPALQGKPSFPPVSASATTSAPCLPSTPSPAVGLAAAAATSPLGPDPAAARSSATLSPWLLALNALPAAVTVCSLPAGAVRCQNDASVLLYGKQLGAASEGVASLAARKQPAADTLWRTDVSFASRADGPDLLSLIFSLEPAKLAAMAAAVAEEGGVWQGIIRVPYGLQATATAPCSHAPESRSSALPIAGGEAWVADPRVIPHAANHVSTFLLDSRIHYCSIPSEAGAAGPRRRTQPGSGEALSSGWQGPHCVTTPGLAAGSRARSASHPVMLLDTSGAHSDAHLPLPLSCIEDRPSNAPASAPPRQGTKPAAFMAAAAAAAAAAAGEPASAAASGSAAGGGAVSRVLRLEVAAAGSAHASAPLPGLLRMLSMPRRMLAPLFGGPSAASSPSPAATPTPTPARRGASQADAAEAQRVCRAVTSLGGDEGEGRRALLTYGKRPSREALPRVVGEGLGLGESASASGMRCAWRDALSGAGAGAEPAGCRPGPGPGHVGAGARRTRSFILGAPSRLRTPAPTPAVAPPPLRECSDDGGGGGGGAPHWPCADSAPPFRPGAEPGRALAARPGRGAYGRRSLDQPRPGPGLLASGPCRRSTVACLLPAGAGAPPAARRAPRPSKSFSVSAAGVWETSTWQVVFDSGREELPRDSPLPAAATSPGEDDTTGAFFRTLDTLDTHLPLPPPPPHPTHRAALAPALHASALSSGPSHPPTRRALHSMLLPAAADKQAQRTSPYHARHAHSMITLAPEPPAEGGGQAKEHGRPDRGAAADLHSAPEPPRAATLPAAAAVDRALRRTSLTLTPASSSASPPPQLELLPVMRFHSVSAGSDWQRPHDLLGAAAAPQGPTPRCAPPPPPPPQLSVLLAPGPAGAAVDAAAALSAADDGGALRMGLDVAAMGGAGRPGHAARGPFVTVDGFMRTSDARAATASCAAAAAAAAAASRVLAGLGVSPVPSAPCAAGGRGRLASLPSSRSLLAPHASHTSRMLAFAQSLATAPTAAALAAGGAAPGSPAAGGPGSGRQRSLRQAGGGARAACACSPGVRPQLAAAAGSGGGRGPDRPVTPREVVLEGEGQGQVWAGGASPPVPIALGTGGCGGGGDGYASASWPARSEGPHPFAAIREERLSASALPDGALADVSPFCSRHAERQGLATPAAQEAARAGASGDCEEEEGVEVAEEVWHEVVAVGCADPSDGSRLVVLMQRDVTAKVVAERHVALVSETEHRLLEQLFPRHVLQYVTEEAAGMLSGARTGSGGGSPANTHTNAPLPPAPDLDSWRPCIRDCDRLATAHEQVTILFADIEGFTPMCKVLPARVVMAFLNDLFSRFDAMLDEHGVYKVETIGDCYMVAGGLIRQDQDGMAAVAAEGDGPGHAAAVVAFARAMLSAARSVRLPTSGEPVRMRVGVHSGPVVSGVVGTRMPRFCLFGDTVNTASRMESTGVPGCVHVSADTYGMLAAAEGRSGVEEQEALLHGWQATGGVEVKGKGRLHTFLCRPTPPLEQQREEEASQGQVY